MSPAISAFHVNIFGIITCSKVGRFSVRCICLSLRQGWHMQSDDGLHFSRKLWLRGRAWGRQKNLFISGEDLPHVGAPWQIQSYLSLYYHREMTLTVWSSMLQLYHCFLLIDLQFLHTTKRFSVYPLVNTRDRKILSKGCPWPCSTNHSAHDHLQTEHSKQDNVSFWA